jgi:hypothetical protein
MLVDETAHERLDLCKIDDATAFVEGIGFAGELCNVTMPVKGLTTAFMPWDAMERIPFQAASDRDHGEGISQR